MITVNKRTGQRQSIWRVIHLNNPKIVFVRLNDRGLSICLQGDDQRYSVNYKWSQLLGRLSQAEFHRQ